MKEKQIQSIRKIGHFWSSEEVFRPKPNFLLTSKGSTKMLPHFFPFTEITIFLSYLCILLSNCNFGQTGMEHRTILLYFYLISVSYCIVTSDKQDETSDNFAVFLYYLCILLYCNFGQVMTKDNFINF